MKASAQEGKEKVSAERRDPSCLQVGAAAPVGPSGQHELFDVALVLAARYAEVAVLAPALAPRVGHQLPHQEKPVRPFAKPLAIPSSAQGFFLSCKGSFSGFVLGSIFPR